MISKSHGLFNIVYLKIYNPEREIPYDRQRAGQADWRFARNHFHCAEWKKGSQRGYAEKGAGGNKSLPVLPSFPQT